MAKTIGIIVGVLAIITTIGGGILGYGKLQESVKNTKEEVIELKTEVVKVDEKIELAEDINMEQTYQIRENAYIQQSVVDAISKLNDKIDKGE